MVPNEWPSVSVCRPGSEDPGSDPVRTVVWIRGEHDTATRAHLSDTLAQAVRLDDADIVVDLSGVTFMDASTIGSLVDAHNRLRARSRSLSVRAPSRVTRQVLGVCGLAFLIDEQPAPKRAPAAPALDSWVAVPAADRVSEPTEPTAAREAASPEPPGAPGRPPVEQTRPSQRRTTS